MKVGWHWGFGAAGVGMTFGVIQYILTKSSLGEAGLDPTIEVDEDSSRYFSIFSIGSILFSLIIISGFVGLWTIDPQLLNQLIVYLILAVAIFYFVYLYCFADLNSAERGNISMLLLLFIGSVLFWAGFDQGGSSLNLFAKDYTDLFIFGWVMPATFLQVANPLMVVIFAPFFAAFWINLGKRNLDLETPQKFALGCFLMGELNDIQKRDAWMLRAENSNLDEIWICQITNISQNNWSSVSESGHFNSLEWRRPKMLGVNLLKHE